ncbi:MAG: Holliday junction branch migration protein RuvA [Firmicutes bacterium]|nr:Holliday junction branch migration protein RuvA [Bacillota bacterium]
MLHYIKGIITETAPGMVCIENQGIGFEVNVPDGSGAYLARNGEVVTLYTAMLVREDDISLYGFTDRESLAFFRVLMTVSGVGAKAALSILSALPVRELKKAILFEDVNAITKAQGVGKKIAQRVVLELKDKIDPSDTGMEACVPEKTITPGSAKEEAVSALMSLGYSRTEAMSAMVGITEEGLSAEEYIKRALRSRR